MVDAGFGQLNEYTASGVPINLGIAYGRGVEEGLAASGNDVFFVQFNLNSIGKYSADTHQLNTSFLTGIISPGGIATSGSDLFVASSGTGTVGAYTTSGAVENATLIGRSQDFNLGALAAANGLLYVAYTKYLETSVVSKISTYTTSGVLVNDSLLTIPTTISALAISNDNLFVSIQDNETIGEYTLSGEIVNASLLTGISRPYGLAVMGDQLLVSTSTTIGGQSQGSVNAYTISNGQVTSSNALVSNLELPEGIVTIATPEPSTYLLLSLAVNGIVFFQFRQKRRCLAANSSKSNRAVSH